MKYRFFKCHYYVYVIDQRLLVKSILRKVGEHYVAHHGRGFHVTQEELKRWETRGTIQWL